MICEYAVPIITTINGPRENVERPCDTETRLYLEQALDLGDAELIPIIDVPGCLEMGSAPVTHRIVTSFGGVFHARMSDVERQWPPRVDPPAELNFLFVATRAIERWCRSMDTQIAALRILEAEVAELRKELGR